MEFCCLPLLDHYRINLPLSRFSVNFILFFLILFFSIFRLFKLYKTPKNCRGSLSCGMVYPSLIQKTSFLLAELVICHCDLLCFILLFLSHFQPEGSPCSWPSSHSPSKHSSHNTSTTAIQTTPSSCVSFFSWPSLPPLISITSESDTNERGAEINSVFISLPSQKTLFPSLPSPSPSLSLVSQTPLPFILHTKYPNSFSSPSLPGSAHT